MILSTPSSAESATISCWFRWFQVIPVRVVSKNIDNGLEQDEVVHEMLGMPGELCLWCRGQFTKGTENANRRRPTVIMIGHRITSVLDNDMVLVLEQGLIEEYDSPTKLLEDKSSSFAKLV
nr:ABC transporter C family member 3-like [Tanacetum cinerariifolium]